MIPRGNLSTSPLPRPQLLLILILALEFTGLPLVDAPQPGDLSKYYSYNPGDFPDQLAFGATGDLYVSLAAANQISVINTDGLVGTEEPRINSTDLDNPAGIAFDSAKKSLLIVNHALLSGDSSHFAVYQMFADDPGNPLETPPLD